jgi:hypothetical protein
MAPGFYSLTYILLAQAVLKKKDWLVELAAALETEENQ